MSRRRKNAGVGYGMIFHGAFKSKADAKKKERQVHGFIQPRNIKGERRFVVMSQRKNPIRRNRRRKRNLFSELRGAMLDPQTGRWAAWERTKKLGTVRAEGETKREAQQELKERMRERKRAARSGNVRPVQAYAPRYANPMELTVMGANPSCEEERRERRQRRRSRARARMIRERGTWNPHEEIIVHPGQTITLKVTE